MIKMSATITIKFDKFTTLDEIHKFMQSVPEHPGIVDTKLGVK